jgi:malonyl-CoA/methylmalonyl-CoA synthetase
LVEQRIENPRVAGSIPALGTIFHCTMINTDPAINNIPQLMLRRMQPNAPFIGDGDGPTRSYAEFWDLAGKLANALASAGAKRGDRVAVQVEKSIPALAIFYACARLGAVFLPLNTAYTSAELDYFISDSEPAVFVCAQEKIGAIKTLATKYRVQSVLTLDSHGSGSLMDAATTHAAEFPDAPSHWDDIAAILYTSGTTGRSKGAMLTHGNLASNALALIETWKFTRDDVLLHALPIYHTHGLFVATNTILLSGGRMIFRQKFDSQDVIARLPSATAMMGVPTFYTRLLQHPGLTRERVQHIRLFISGSAPLLADTHQQFRERAGHAILERYGMTETNMNTSNPYDGDRRAGTVGFPLPGVEVRITGAEGTEVPQGDIGMIEVKGPNVCKGYWRMPEKTAEDFRSDGFFITGDLGVIGQDGYISIVGRGKDLIITGGFNVYPKEVESEIDAITGVMESAVIGVPHIDFGEGVTAIVARDPKGPKLTEQDVIAHLESRLAKFKQPKRVIFVDDLPRNAMGKVQKKELRDQYARIYQ